MKKRIPVDELRTQMFVCGFGDAENAPDTMPAEFMLTSDAEIARLRSFFGSVWIDTSLGRDVDDGEARRPPEPVSDPAPDTAPDRQAMHDARRLHGRARRVVDKLIQDIRFGRALDLGSAQEVVQDTLQSMLENPNALLYLAQLKSADAGLAQRAVNTAILSLAFAKCISIPKSDVPNLGMAALLYDLGMITVPGSIRNKPGRLKGEEFERVKDHVDASIELLRQVEGMDEKVLRVIETHHERVDGSGYPRGLKGKQINLLGRMLAIVSVYFTLTSFRPYAQPVSMKDALAILYEQGDKAYDLRLVHKFIRCIGVYPPGCAVELESGEVALVVAAGSEDPLRPVLRVYFDGNKHRVEPPYLLDLASRPDCCPVSRVLQPREYDVVTAADGVSDQLVLRTN